MAINFYTPKFYAFNNFSAHAVQFEGKLYPTSEAAYQAAKCTDLKGKEEIRNALALNKQKYLQTRSIKMLKILNGRAKRLK